MFGLKELISFSSKNARIVLAFLAINLLIGAILIPAKLGKQYQATVKVAFNELKSLDTDNHVREHLFSIPVSPDHSEFLGLIQSDTLIHKTIQRFNLIEHYGIDPEHPQALRKANSILRKRLEFVDDTRILTLKFKDEDGAVARSALVYLTKSVKQLKAERVRQNNEVTKAVLETQKASIETDLETLEEEIITLSKGSEFLKSKKIGVLMGLMSQKMSRQSKLEGQIELIESGSTISPYKSYDVITSNSNDISLNPIIVFFLALIALMVLTVFELQIAFLFSQIRKVINQTNEGSELKANKVE